MTVDSGSSVVTTPKTTRQQDVLRLPSLTTGNCPWIFKLNEDLGTISSGCTASTRKSSSKLKHFFAPRRRFLCSWLTERGI